MTPEEVWREAKEASAARYSECFREGLKGGWLDEADQAAISVIRTAMEAYAAEKVAEAMGWRPIETAPHDEVILLYWKDWSGAEYMEATRFSTGKRLPNGFSNYSEHGWATHWMPLPSPPAMQQASQQERNDG